MTGARSRSPAHPSNGCVTLGAWQRLKGRRSRSRSSRAEVLDGASSYVLPFTDRRRREPLGALVSNAALRRALFECVQQAQRNCDLFAGSTAHIAASDDKAPACDSGWWRHSRQAHQSGPTPASRPCAKARASAHRMVDFGRTMLVCRVRHTRAHDNVATEWFDRGQTIAMLPLLGPAIALSS
jgi:2-polyprenyl-6-methoxyphenol hydroxylase-like FAD-dependent oxidoreductase